MEMYIYLLVALSTLYIISQYQPSLPDGSELTRLMRRFQRIASATRLEFWAIGGTALGVYKTGDILPFDDDIDLGIFKLNPTQRRAFQELGLKETRFGYTIKHPRCASEINLFVFSIQDHKLTPSPWVQRTFSNEWLWASELKPLRMVNTSLGPIPLPKGVVSYLQRQYPGHMKQSSFTFKPG
jgi:hypothetical protein